MFDLLISRLQDFAADNNLILEFAATENELAYTIQDTYRAWGYGRVVSRAQYEMYAGDRTYLVEYEISRLRRRLRESRLI